jgi:hypothetical protein
MDRASYSLFPLWRPFIFVLFTLMAIVGISALVRIADSQPAPPLPFVLVWVLVLLWCAYWFLFRVSYRVDGLNPDFLSSLPSFIDAQPRSSFTLRWMTRWRALARVETDSGARSRGSGRPERPNFFGTSILNNLSASDSPRDQLTDP